MFESIKKLFSGDGFPARWDCGSAWSAEPWWGWLHILSDLLIFAAYFAIPLTLVRFIRRRGDLPFPGVICLFAGFILACGTTHVLEAIIFYWPAYRLSGLLKLGTAIISIATVAKLQSVMPLALTLRSPEESEKEVLRKTSELQETTAKLSEAIAKSRRANSALRDSRETLRLALKAGDTGFFNWDLETQKVTLDETEIRITGLGTDRPKIDPNTFLDCIAPEHVDEVRNAVEATIQDAHDYEQRFAFTRPDGRRIWLEGTGCLIRDSEGKPLRFIGLNRDITEQVEREAELDEQAREAEWQNEQKSLFIAQVSHEIRTPLTAMLGCVDALLADVRDEKTRGTVRLLRTQGETLRILVNDVLDLAKIEAGKLEIDRRPVDLCDLLAETRSLLDPLATEKGLELNCMATTLVPERVVVDPYRLKQVLINLVGNAIKFTDEGKVSIVVGIEQHRGEQTLVIDVRDTGPGIPAEKLDVLFEEYEQVQHDDVGGAGLGLAISKRLTDLMGGSISVSSDLGKGATFTVRTPLEPHESKLVPLSLITKLDSMEEEEVPVHFPLRILAAEDTRAIQFVLRRMVGGLVDEIVVVSDGEEAVEAVRKAAQTDKPFDAILMDIQMPKMDGTQATSILRSEGYQLPIVALTAGAMESERNACMSAGCTHFLPKPIDVTKLRELLGSIAENNP